MLLVATRVLVVLRSGAVDMRVTAREHRVLLEAIRAGDAALAGRLAYEHVRRKAPTET
jgi:DNA-binding GntR family transcriptional regulator